MATTTPMPTKTKSKQMILLVAILAAGVFLATFISNYTSSGPPPKKIGGDDPTSIPNLVFWGSKTAQFTWPVWKPWQDGPLEVGNISPEREYTQEGHHDFFFQNTSDDALHIGLNDKSCKCAHVEIATWPREWVAFPNLVIAGVTQVADAWTPFGHFGVLAGTQEDLTKRPYGDPELNWRAVEREDDKGVEVPAHAAGWVRVNWKKREDKAAGPTLVHAQLWSQYKDSGVLTRLEVPLVLVEPIRTRPENTVDFGVLGAGDTVTREVLVVSSTRPNFPVKLEFSQDALVQVSQPVELTQEECKKLWFKTGTEPDMGHIVKAYKMNVTVHEQAGGKHLDLGIFTRRLTLLTDADVDPINLAITGKVRGGISIGTPDARDRADLGHFPSEAGATRDVPIMTEIGDLKLALDTLPDMLKDTTIEEVKDSLPRSWVLHVVLSPNRWEGILPRDLAIYLKADGPTTRRVRIPVTGDAYHR
jgi:hypothetical protein